MLIHVVLCLTLNYFQFHCSFQAGLQLGSSHAILVGDPQQLPATIFSMSGRNSKYDRSLFARLEEAGHAVHMLDTQFRMVRVCLVILGFAFCYLYIT